MGRRFRLRLGMLTVGLARPPARRRSRANYSVTATPSDTFTPEPGHGHPGRHRHLDERAAATTMSTSTTTPSSCRRRLRPMPGLLPSCSARSGSFPYYCEIHGGPGGTECQARSWSTPRPAAVAAAEGAAATPGPGPGPGPDPAPVVIDGRLLHAGRRQAFRACLHERGRHADGDGHGERSRRREGLRAQARRAARSRPARS